MDPPTHHESSDTRRIKIKILITRKVAQIPTAASFGLLHCPFPSNTRFSYEFLRPWLNPDQVSKKSQGFWIEPIGRSTKFGVDPVFTYTMSVRTQSFIVDGAFLVNLDTEARFTEMRAWQLIAASWLAGGGTQPPGRRDGLKYLVFREVVEAQSCEALRRELRRQNCRNTDNGHWAKPAKLTTASMCWKKTPFIRCAERVAAALSTASKEIKATRAWVAYKSIDIGESEFHLVVELASLTNIAMEAVRL